MAKQSSRRQLFLPTWDTGEALGASLPSPSPRRLSKAGADLVKGIARAGQAGGEVIVSELSQVHHAFSSAGTALFGERPASATLERAKRLFDLGNLQTLQNAFTLDDGVLPKLLPSPWKSLSYVRASSGAEDEDQEEDGEAIFTLETTSPAKQRPGKRLQKQVSSDPHPFL